MSEVAADDDEGRAQSIGGGDRALEVGRLPREAGVGGKKAELRIGHLDEKEPRAVGGGADGMAAASDGGKNASRQRDAGRTPTRREPLGACAPPLQGLSR